MRPLFFAHSGLRYLVILTGLVAILVLGYMIVTRRGNPRTSRIISSVFVGLLDLQGLLGLLTIATGLYYPGVLRHVFLMIGAIAAAHVASALAKSADPHRANQLRLFGVVTALLLIVLGILSIGRTLFGSAGPSLGG